MIGRSDSSEVFLIPDEHMTRKHHLVKMIVEAVAEGLKQIRERLDIDGQQFFVQLPAATAESS